MLIQWIELVISQIGDCAGLEHYPPSLFFFGIKIFSKPPNHASLVRVSHFHFFIYSFEYSSAKIKQHNWFIRDILEFETQMLYPVFVRLEWFTWRHWCP